MPVNGRNSDSSTNGSSSAPSNNEIRPESVTVDRTKPVVVSSELFLATSSVVVTHGTYNVRTGQIISGASIIYSPKRLPSGVFSLETTVYQAATATKYNRQVVPPVTINAHTSVNPKIIIDSVHFFKTSLQWFIYYREPQKFEK